jgi:hypothetical protein
LVEPTASGGPASPLHWTPKSVRQPAAALQAMVHVVSRQLMAELLAGRRLQPAGYSKTREGPQHPDRDAQFRYIHTSTNKSVGSKRQASPWSPSIQRRGN